jgi:hypothetical protein
VDDCDRIKGKIKERISHEQKKNRWRKGISCPKIPNW